MKPGYHYRQSGLPNVWLMNGFEIIDTPYGEGVSIQDVHGLHLCIARVLCKKPSELTGAEFRFLRRELDFSQEMIGTLFGRSKRQIGNIERRQEPVQEPFNTLIRHIYLAKINPENSYLEVFQRLRSIDIEWHEDLSFTQPSAAEDPIVDHESWQSNIKEIAYA